MLLMALNASMCNWNRILSVTEKSLFNVPSMLKYFGPLILE
jgi:hypothetical protein